MEQEITHVIFLRPESPLNLLFQDCCKTVKHLPAARALYCTHMTDGLPGFASAHVSWSHPPSPRPFQIPLEEILLIADVRGSDPQTIGFLRAES